VSIFLPFFFYFLTFLLTCPDSIVRRSNVKNSKIQCKKTYQFKTQFKGDINHASKTAEITVFDPVICKTPDAPLQNELLY